LRPFGTPLFREFAAGEAAQRMALRAVCFNVTAEAVTYKARGAGAPLFREFAAGEAAQRLALCADCFMSRLKP
jgi:hypothetical protein